MIFMLFFIFMANNIKILLFLRNYKKTFPQKTLNGITFLQNMEKLVLNRMEKMSEKNYLRTYSACP